MPRIRYRLFQGGLHLNTTSDNAPEGTVRRVRNFTPLSSGVARTAPPQVTITTGNAVARSLTKFATKYVVRGTSGGEKVQIETAGGSGVFVDVTMPTGVTLRSTAQPTLFMTAPPTPERDEYLFALETAQQVGDKGLYKLKSDGTSSLWGIIGPSATDVTGISTAKNAQSAKYINTAAADPFNSAADWTLSAADEDGLKAATALTDVATPSISANALKLVVARDDQAQIVRVFGGNIDLTTFGAVASPEEDFIELWVRVRRPKHITSMEIAFDTTAAGDFKKDFFTREVLFQTVKKTKKRQLLAVGDLIPAGKGQELGFIKDQHSRSEDLSLSEKLGNQKVLVSKNTWSRVTLPKTSFDHSGSPDWSTVRAIRVTVQANKQGKTAVFLDELRLVGGVGMFGDYDYTITYKNTSTGTRSNPAIDDDAGTATKLPNSVVKISVANVERQSVTLTFPALSFDPQVDKVEIWRTLGNGKAYFKAGELNPTSSGAVAMGTTFIDSTADYFGLHSSADAVLDPTEELPLDNTSPNDPDFCFRDMIDRLHYGRMWWTNDVATTDTFSGKTKDSRGLAYYSPIGRVEAVDAFVEITAGKTEPIQRIVVWNDRLFAFTTGAMYEIVGTDEPFVPQRIEGAPGTLQPWTVCASPVGLLWLAEDGIYLFNGQYAKNITDAALLPVFRYKQTTEELGAPAAFPLCRAIVGRNSYYLTSMGANPTFTLVLDFDSATWRYIDGFTAAGNNLGAMYFDHAQGKVIGDSSLNSSTPDITEIDPATYPTSGTIATATLQPPSYRTGPGRQGILRKVYIDVTTGANGAGGTLTPSTVINETVTALTAFSGPAAGVRTVQEYNVNQAGDRFGMRLGLAAVRDVTINAIEMDIYEPDLDE